MAGMKTKGILIMVILFLAFTGFQPGDRKEKKMQQEKEMIELIESGHFRFVASSAKSSLGYFNNLGSTYDLVFDSLMLKAYLPYYGRAYSVPYGSDGGVKFNLTAEKIEKVLNEKKKMFSITTQVSDSHDSYLIFLTIGTNGYADLQLSFSNREMISYYGEIAKIKKDQ
jgi:hypothetical protein